MRVASAVERTACRTPLHGFASGCQWSWDPLKDAENVLPEGAPNEGKIIQARHQVREMKEDALASLYEIAPSARRAIEHSAGYAVFSTFGIKLFLPAVRRVKGWLSTGKPVARPS